MTEAQPSKGEKTRAKLIDTTGSLLHRHGYHGVGLNQILAESGTPRGSLYFHFPGGKEELAVAALAAASAQAQAGLRAMLEQASGPAHAVSLMCGHSALAMAASGWQSGCPIATTALEACGESEALRRAAQTHFAAMTGLIAAYLEARGVASARAAELGVIALSAVEGAMLLAKVQRSAEPIHIIEHSLATLLGEETTTQR